jgi:glycosyltransferase involved in cell wall biosynthesis
MISVGIFTLNEAVNLPFCLESLKKVSCDDIVIIDSFSTDPTCELATRAGARVFQNQFTGFGDQRMWAVSNITFRHPWLLILDADERVTPELWKEMLERLARCTDTTSAFRLKRKFYWEGVWLKRANLYPTWVVRLIRLGKVKYVNRGHAETQEVDGEIESLKEDLIDENHKGFTNWLKRQKTYAEQEAQYEVSTSPNMSILSLFNRDPLIRRAASKFYFRRLPLRGFFYFGYVYFFRFGFLDGWNGFRFCFEKAKMQSYTQKVVHDLRKGTIKTSH